MEAAPLPEIISGQKISEHLKKHNLHTDVSTLLIYVLSYLTCMSVLMFLNKSQNFSRS